MNKNSTFCSILFLLTISQPLQAQTDSIDLQKDSHSLNSRIEAIVLQEVDFHLLPDFNNTLDRDYYFWLQKKVKIVWPYYLEAVREYRNIIEDLKKVQKKKLAREIVQRRQEQLAQKYETKLKSLSVSEGKILVMLIQRKTGKTVYQIIKELKGSWSAFWWSFKANFFDIDLKKVFEPKRYRMDAFIDVIVKKNLAEGSLTDLP